MLQFPLPSQHAKSGVAEVMIIGMNIRSCSFDDIRTGLLQHFFTHIFL